ncbi:hypothetical protein [Clostridium uliginosum]|uniref:Uncharacterized protein n=1 Tax=Clostridium uliginosum TaxID=119641 RepID=A0A1I1N479_9CLOT|nr:hypothetical protein [Clostridium uliginosum]SFC92235.1 hypothetical protein SAMN05421842_11379 [Clostridium uliginosum]
MGLIKVLSIAYLVFTFILMLNKRKTWNAFIVFGIITLIFVMIYGNLPTIPEKYTPVAIFILFSLMITLFGLMNGGIIYLLKRSNKASIIVSIVSSILLMLLIFNKVGFISYIFIPLLLYKGQDEFNKLMKINNIILK